MDRRLELHEKLKSIVGPNVYFQPPASIQLSYPCVIYNIGKGAATYANNRVYGYTHKYDLIFIYKKPNQGIIDEVLQTFQMCSVSRTYVTDNLNHYAFSLYY